MLPSLPPCYFLGDLGLQLLDQYFLVLFICFLSPSLPRFAHHVHSSGFVAHIRLSSTVFASSSLPSPFQSCISSFASTPFSFPLRFCPHQRSRPRSRPRPCSRLRFNPRPQSCPRPRTLFPVPQTRLHPRYDARVLTPVCVFVCECACLLSFT